MGANAGMALVLNRPWQAWEVSALSDRLFVIFYHELFFGFKQKESTVRLRGQEQVVDAWCEELGDTIQMPDNHVLDVELTCRFFDAQYCRGPIGAIYMLAEYVEKATGCEVFYWSDEDVTDVSFHLNLFNAPARDALLKNLAKEQIVRWGTSFAANVILAPDRKGPNQSYTLHKE